jgi:hypothetical protein
MSERRVAGEPGPWTEDRGPRTEDPILREFKFRNVYRFPPKWGINDRLPQQPVLSVPLPTAHAQGALL